MSSSAKLNLNRFKLCCNSINHCSFTDNSISSLINSSINCQFQQLYQFQQLQQLCQHEKHLISQIQSVNLISMLNLSSMLSLNLLLISLSSLFLFLQSNL